LGIFLLTTASTPVLGTSNPPNKLLPGALYPGVKRPEREADHSSATNTDVKNAWSYTSVPKYALMAWCSVKSTGTTLPLKGNKFKPNGKFP